ncbi:hypothetical protein [Nocardioides sp. GCM10030258]|uniref:hypothetical protein n=1 Tax=unclassified Nocardioides TaxID=2615069 RepID=UPI00361C527D
MSSAEWRRAEELRGAAAKPVQYAVLAMRRPKGSDTPVALGVLEDPHSLAEQGFLTMDTDTYKVRYRTDPED